MARAGLIRGSLVGHLMILQNSNCYSLSIMFEYPQFPLYYGASEPGPSDELLDYSQLDPREPLESQSHSAITLDALVSRPATSQVDAVSVSHQSSPGHPPGEVSSSKEERLVRGYYESTGSV